MPTQFPDPRQKPWLSVDELAGLLKQPRSTTYSQVKRGAFPTVRVSQHRVKIPTAKLLDLLGIGVDSTGTNQRQVSAEVDVDSHVGAEPCREQTALAGNDLKPPELLLRPIRPSSER